MIKKSSLIFFLLLLSIAGYGADNSSTLLTSANELNIIYLADGPHANVQVFEWNEEIKNKIDNLEQNVKIWLYLYAENLIVDKKFLKPILKNNLARLWIEGAFNITTDALDIFVDEPTWDLDLSSKNLGWHIFKVTPTNKDNAWFNYGAKYGSLVEPHFFLDKISQIPHAVSITITDVTLLPATLKLMEERGLTLATMTPDRINDENTNNKTGTTFFFSRKPSEPNKNIFVDNKSLDDLPSVTYDEDLTQGILKKIANQKFNELSIQTLHPAITAEDMPLVKHIKIFSWNDHVKRVLLNMPNLPEITVYHSDPEFLTREDFDAFVNFAREKKCESAFFSAPTGNYTHRHINVGAINDSLLNKIIRGSLHELVIIDAAMDADAIAVLKKLTLINTLDLSKTNINFDDIVQILESKNMLTTLILPRSLALEHKSFLNNRFPGIRIPLAD